MVETVSCYIIYNGTKSNEVNSILIFITNYRETNPEIVNDISYCGHVAAWKLKAQLRSDIS